MELLGIIIAILVIANVVWGIQVNFRGGWPFWVNFVGSIVLALIVFTSLL